MANKRDLLEVMRTLQSMGEQEKAAAMSKASGLPLPVLQDEFSDDNEKRRWLKIRSLMEDK